jgi:hypothetical protein
MANVTIFKQGAITTTGTREPSELAKTFVNAKTTRRIQTNTNGTFKRIINGEQVGNAVRGEVNVIVVGALREVSRVFYKGKFDPNAKPTLPDCWSNAGDKPEAAAANKQNGNCADCSQNVKGSGDNGGRACRYQRRISVILEGDATGEIYQFNVPAKSLFGKGVGNVHPFESYVKYLSAHGEALDTVVTNISYNLNADSMELLFTPQRNLSDEEYVVVKEAQTNPEARSYTMLTVAQADGVTKQPEAVAAPAPTPKFVFSDEPDDEVVEPVAEEPVKRATKKAAEPVVETKRSLADVVSAWGDEDA